MDPRIKLSSKLEADELEAAGSEADAVRCFRLMSLASQRLRYLLDRRLRDEGLTVRQAISLSSVRPTANPPLGEAAQSLATSPQNAKQTALAVARRGLTRTGDDKADRRARRLIAPRAGQRGWHRRNAEDFAAIGQWFSGLSRSEQKELAAMLVKLIRGLH